MSAEEREPTPRRAGRVKDARGRSVTQLDAVTMRLLREHGVIEADVLRAIASEKGVAISTWERVLLVYSLIAFVATVVGTISYFMAGPTGSTLVRRMASFTWYSFWPVFFWWKIKQGRFQNTTAAMLKYLRCPHCGYDIRGLRESAEDHATVCPECGCAWRLADSRIAGSPCGD